MKNNMSEIEKMIVKTIVYYDGMDYPLTAFEVWKNAISTNYLPALLRKALQAGESDTNIRMYECEKDDLRQGKRNVELFKITELLESEKLKNYIEEFRGFYFFKGRKCLVEDRIRKNKIALLKLKRLKKVVWWLRFIPFVRMVAVTGRLAMKNTEGESDWDLFVSLKKGKIWTGRTLITVFLHLIKKRRHGNKIKDRICLNYFVTDESLKIKIENRPFEVNLFSASEYSFMFPLFGFGNFHKFQIRNYWIKEFKPNYEIAESENLNIISDSIFSKTARNCGEKLLKFRFIENFLREIEMKKIANNPKTHKSGSVIEASDENLVFLPEPQGKEIYDNCGKKLEELKI